MYKITVHFISDVAGVYTKEEETSDSRDRMIKKKCRMLDRWVKIMCHFDDACNDDLDEMCDDEKLELIQREVKRLNNDFCSDQPRQFLFYVERYR